MSTAGLPLRSTLDFEAVAAKYPKFPRLILLKIDMHRRGVYYTEEALKLFDPQVHQTVGTHIFGTRDGDFKLRPEALLLRDGTSVITTPTPLDADPYVVDAENGGLAIKDHGEVLDEAFYWEKPAYYDKFTSKGTLMQNVAGARPQRMYIAANRYCHFWTRREGCRFCDIVNNVKHQKAELKMPVKVDLEDLAETIAEAVKEPGRHTAVFLTAGSDFHGNNAFDAEIDFYIDILKVIGGHFSSSKIPCQVALSAVTREQLRRLYDNTCVTSVTMNIEVLNERLFEVVCPGKARWVGYAEWKKRLIDAVEVVGPGLVNTGIVSGVELVQPAGFRSEEEALESVLREAEDLAGKGVSTVNMVWQPRPGSIFGKEKNASLEYYVQLAWELQQIRIRHKLSIDFDDYRRCGN
ncbi:MAG: hypothetical protein LBS65_04085, partial [Desulfovibrio sp.]|nr:hypothetical protein [Desulfovibrio sp.]